MVIRVQGSITNDVGRLKTKDEIKPPHYPRGFQIAYINEPYKLVYLDSQCECDDDGCSFRIEVPFSEFMRVKEL